MKSIKVKFWGVRGSIPTPGPSTLLYGGNTACVSVEFTDGPFFILDAGTGIRELGKSLLKTKRPIHAYIFISHFHWDHIQGLPFFKPAFVPGNKFTIFGTDDTTLDLDQIISFQMNPTYFPVAIQDMRADIRFKSIKEETFFIDDVKVQTQYLNHPGYTLGFRLTYKGKSIVYISDNEPFQFNTDLNDQPLVLTEIDDVETLFNNFKENKDERLINFCKETDLLIHDTQFFPEEYESKVTWGHSPYNYTVQLAIRSKVQRLILFHHDPDHDDHTIDKIQELSRKSLFEAGVHIPCDAAKEGMEIEI